MLVASPRLDFKLNRIHLEAMTEKPEKLRARAKRKDARRGEKKRLIADSAIEALKELGYANTSLRDIAAKSGLSLGMLHYYFEDRTELIIYCVRMYKEAFVRDVKEALNDVEGREQAIEAFAEALTSRIIDDEMTHRLWYDISAQSMFDDLFRPVVSEIEELLIGVVRALFQAAGESSSEHIELKYAFLDGAFRHLTQGQFTETPRSRSEIKTIFLSVLEELV